MFRKTCTLVVVCLFIGLIALPISAQESTLEPGVTYTCVTDMETPRTDGDATTALAALNRDLRHDPDDLDLLYERGNLNRDMGNFDEAIEDFTRVRDLDPAFDSNPFGIDFVACNLAGTYRLRGLDRFAQRDYEGAIEDFTLALDTDGSHGISAPTYFDRAFAYINLGELDLAAADLDAQLAIVAYPPAYDFRGRIAASRGNNEAAIEDFTALIEMGYATANIYLYRARAWYALQDYEAAIADLTEAIALEPTITQGYILRAAAYTELGDDDNAAADYWHYIQFLETERLDAIMPPNGDPLTVSMTGGRVFSIPFEARARQRVTITAAGDDSLVDPLIVILDSDGNAIIANDDSSDDTLDSAIEAFRLPSTGEYTLIVSHALGGSEGDVIVTLEVR